MDAYEGQLRHLATSAPADASLSQLRDVERYIEGLLADVRVRIALLKK